MAAQLPPNHVGDALLQPVNDLTRLSARFGGAPGFLNYDTYKTYLTALGHVKNPPANFPIPYSQTLLNSSLQIVQAPTIPATDVTDWRADQDLWSREHMPNLVYAFEQPHDWLSAKDLNDPPLKTYLIHGQYLRDIPILPDQISSEIEGWRLEAYWRFDPRIQLKDILFRMHLDVRHSQQTTLQMRNNRFREACDILGWVNKGKNYQENQKNISAKLAAAGIPQGLNTTRGVSWGLIDVAQGEAGGRIAVPERHSNKPAKVQPRPAQLHVVRSALPVAQPAAVKSAGPLTYSNTNSPTNTSSSLLSNTPPPQTTAGRSWRASMQQLPTLKPRSIKVAPRNSSLLSMISFHGDETADNTDFDKSESAGFELRLNAPQSLPQSHGPYVALNDRSRKVRKRFGDPGCKKRRRIPQDVIDSLEQHSFPSMYTDGSSPPKRLRGQDGSVIAFDLFQEVVVNPVLEEILLESSAAVRDRPAVSLPQCRQAFVHRIPIIPAAPLQPQPQYVVPAPQYAVPMPVTVPYGNITLTFRTDCERLHPSATDSLIVNTWQRAGSAERHRQLEFLLDPLLARHGFRDDNGYFPPVGGSHPHGDIWYTVTREEALELDGYVTSPINEQDDWAMVGRYGVSWT